MQLLETHDQLDAVLVKSRENPVAIFKHSSSCPVSARVRERVDQAAQEGAFGVPLYELVVQEAREISNKVEEKTGVAHETPQLIVLESIEPVYVASHQDIDPAEAHEAVADAYGDRV